jgi:hypothetical protein
MARLPPVAANEAVTFAVSRPTLTKVVGSGAPFSLTMLSDTKPDPATVNVKSLHPTGTVVGEIPVTRGAVAWGLSTASEPPPQPSRAVRKQEMEMRETYRHRPG